MAKKKYIVVKRRNDNSAYEYHLAYTDKNKAKRMVSRLRHIGIDAKIAKLN